MKQASLPIVGITFEEKVDDAIKLLQEFEPSALEYSDDGYYLCFSGGKDSVVIKDLAIRSGVKFKAHYNCTTIDPPELTRFIKHHHPDVVWNIKKIPFFKNIVKRGLPSRRFRWCCSEYKENFGDGTVKIFGIRAQESPRRARQWENITAWKGKKKGWVVNPILQWNTSDVWKYIINFAEIPYCRLYDENFSRLGCIGCPMSANKQREFERWPHIERLWRKAAKKRWEIASDDARSKKTFKNSDEWFDWWKSNQPMPDKNDCQMGLF